MANCLARADTMLVNILLWLRPENTLSKILIIYIMYCSVDIIKMKIEWIVELPINEKNSVQY